MNIKKLLLDKKIGGELVKNIGLGIFVNALYGISSGSFELFNLIDVFIGLSAMIIGIILERR